MFYYYDDETLAMSLKEQNEGNVLDESARISHPWLENWMGSQLAFIV